MPNKFILPVPSYCFETFTYDEHKAYAIKYGYGWKPGMSAPHYYPGRDFAAAHSLASTVDVPIYAPAAGTISEVRNDATGYGTHVRIDHGDGDLSIMGHMKTVKVKAGQKVKAGDVLGVMGWTGNVRPDGPAGRHLHWEMRRKNMPTDTSGMMVAVIEPHPEPEPEQPPAEEKLGPVLIPELPAIMVTAKMLNIREKPDVKSRDVGDLFSSDIVRVMRIIKNGADEWLQIGHMQYIARVFQGDVNAKWV